MPIEKILQEYAKLHLSLSSQMEQNALLMAKLAALEARVKDLLKKYEPDSLPKETPKDGPKLVDAALASK